MEKKITIYTLAEELQMTPSAVSRAFNPNTKLDPEKRKRILEAADRYGFRPNRMASRLSMDTVRIGILIYGGFFPFYRKIEEGIKAAYARLADYKIECDMRILPREEYSPEDCSVVLQEFVQKEYGGVIVCGLYDMNILKIVSDSSSKLVSVHYPLPREMCLFSSVHSFSTAGQMAADILQICGRKRILLFTGDQTSVVHSRIRDSFLKQAEICHMQITEICDFPETMKNWSETAENYIAEKKGRFDGIYITTGRSIEICRAVKKLYDPGEITVIATDIYPEITEYMEDGTVSACLFQNQYAQAEKAFEILAKYLIERMDIPEDSELTPLFISRSNYRKYL